MFGKKQTKLEATRRGGCSEIGFRFVTIGEVGRGNLERADLLFHRLETRRDARVRTPFEIQQGIETVFRASGALREVEMLSRGTLIRDVEGAVGRMGSLMGWWRSLSLLSATSPCTESTWSTWSAVCNLGPRSVSLRSSNSCG